MEINNEKDQFKEFSRIILINTRIAYRMLLLKWFIIERISSVC